MVATRTSLTGGLGSRQVGEVFGERYELPPDLSYNETCASAASIQWSWRLLLATGRARYADLIERTLYNAFAAARSDDGRTHDKGNPLQRRADHAEAVGDPRCRDEWFFSACCPPAGHPPGRLVGALRRDRLRACRCAHLPPASVRLDRSGHPLRGRQAEAAGRDRPPLERAGRDHRHRGAGGPWRSPCASPLERDDPPGHPDRKDLVVTADEDGTSYCAGRGGRVTPWRCTWT